MARTPARSTSGPGVSGTGGFSLFRFFGEVFSELRKVSWPTRQEATRLTVMVIALSATIGLFLGLVDMAFARLISAISGT
ncbi:preprotein translocase subunit SecE [Candidatus Lucifugimonas marina]|uniref:Protein translocase subunit SecE n=1 Tax=Candidatus Lucifugimonas marina TaxID=3038979 RepID=A0AAJ5ZGZ4_9CHLR|nr:preprotein translocase subunit SecE [SAR202 cluster bacterium JH702]MDG0869944.1 preprotein translocase subunit SecE [SAR202 cluster bacterium JH639]WFG34668.1 preprotein translocase subunit SecE [SAR202 cluster bacterium JH545]WFG38596.1 preprotein translocase subunit SecE [SAR202 cluster bacterium JH1073]